MRRRNQYGFRLSLGFPINVASHLEVEAKNKMIRGKTVGKENIWETGKCISEGWTQLEFQQISVHWMYLYIVVEVTVVNCINNNRMIIAANADFHLLHTVL